ncbi:MAG TPA: hypothetical protein PKD73_10165 [Burkholderiaceae bacterium]|nr:hypothetical protein [Burkholderiaceae bacterium]
MGIARTLLSAGMAVVTLTAAAEQVTLKATNGQVISRSLGKPAKHLVINGTISVAQFSDSEGWPTKVSVGYHGSESDETGVQLTLTRRETRGDVIIGYRVMEGSREFRFIELGRADPGKPVKFSMRFAPELVTIKFEHLRDQYVQTPLKVAEPRAWATSGTLVFDGTIENPR